MFEFLKKLFRKKPPKKDYRSHIDKVPVYCTSRGSMYVKPFDVIRSPEGRKLINSMAKMKVPYKLPF